MLQDAAGGTVAIGNQDIRAHGFRPSQQDVYEFIKQCGELDPSRVSPRHMSSYALFLFLLIFVDCIMNYGDFGGGVWMNI